MTQLRSAGCLLLILSLSVTVSADDAPPVQKYLTESRLQDGATAMQSAIDADSGDQQAQFSLGVIQFLQAIEGLGQDHYRYGLGSNRMPAIVFLRLPVPSNPAPERISYVAARQILQNIVDRLATAERTLAKVTSADVKLPLPLEKICLDISGNGKCGTEESLGHIIDSIQRRRRNHPDVQEPGNLIVQFDVADAVWLRGYCRALSAMGEMILAYDWSDQFERTAHLLYPDVDTPFDYLNDEGTGGLIGFGGQNILDLIALVHMINYDLVEPERMPRALAHWEAVIQLSRESWQLIQAEDDDANEWLPGPHQTPVITELRVGQELVTAWHEFLDEIESILLGEKLVPFWRGIPGGVNSVNVFPQHPTLGINIRRVFTEPGRFDLALWLQGTGLQPWLEEGEIVDPADWNAMLRGFNNNFWPVFFWFN